MFIKNAHVITPGKDLGVVDVLVDGDRIAAVGSRVPRDRSDDCVLDATGLALLFVAYFIVQATRQLYYASIPPIRSDLGLGATTLGMVATVFLLVYGVSAPCAFFAVVTGSLAWACAHALPLLPCGHAGRVTLPGVFERVGARVPRARLRTAFVVDSNESRKQGENKNEAG